MIVSTEPFQHLLSINDLSHSHIELLFKKASKFLSLIPQNTLIPSSLNHKTLALLFLEPSTRTQISFELSAKRLGMHTITINNQQSSLCKGESYIDTLKTLEAMGCHYFVIRHKEANFCDKLAPYLDHQSHLINAGTGAQAHPTQALLDAFTISQYKSSWQTLTVAIIGDSRHSRVAHSQIALFHALGIKDIRLIGPKSLLPKNANTLGVTLYHDCQLGLADADIVIALRIQKERILQSELPTFTDYYKQYGLTTERFSLAKSDALLLHPGPINRNIEIGNSLIEHPRSCILQQVTNGLAMRMAILDTLG